MSSTLIALVTFAYIGVAVSEVRSGHLDMATVFFGYSIANIGMIMQVYK